MISLASSHTKLLDDIKSTKSCLGDYLRPYKDLCRQHNNLKKEVGNRNEA